MARRGTNVFPMAYARTAASVPIKGTSIPPGRITIECTARTRTGAIVSMYVTLA